MARTGIKKDGRFSTGGVWMPDGMYEKIKETSRISPRPLPDAVSVHCLLANTGE